MHLLHSADILWLSTARENDHLCHLRFKFTHEISINKFEIQNFQGRIWNLINILRYLCA